MKKYFLFFFILTFLNCDKKKGLPKVGSSFLGNIESIITFGGSKNESAQSIVATDDGGFVVAGFTQSNDGDVQGKTNENFDYWILKINAQNDIEWQKTIGGSSTDKANDIIKTSDGGFAILGYSESNDGNTTLNAGSKDFWVVKLDVSGNIIWQKSLGYSGNDFGVSLTETKDKGLLIVGELDVTASGGQGNSKTSSRHAGGDFWAIKLNVLGEKQWSKYYGGSFTDTPRGIVETDEGNFIIVGSSDSKDVDVSNNKGTYDFWIIKIDAVGKLIWEKNFGGKEIDEARGIVKSEDGNYLVVGDTRSSDGNITNQKGAADVWVIKINESGNLLWQKSYGGSSFDVARSISKTKNNQFIIAGSSRSSDIDVKINQGQNDVWMLKIDNNGQLLWQKSVGGTEIDFGYDAVELKNGNIVVVGESSSENTDIAENKGFTDLLIVKIK